MYTVMIVCFDSEDQARSDGDITWWWRYRQALRESNMREYLVVYGWFLAHTRTPYHATMAPRSTNVDTPLAKFPKAKTRREVPLLWETNHIRMVEEHRQQMHGWYRMPKEISNA